MCSCDFKGRKRVRKKHLETWKQWFYHAKTMIFNTNHICLKKNTPGRVQGRLGDALGSLTPKMTKKTSVFWEGFWSHFLSIFTQKLKKWTLKNDPFLEARFYCFFEIWTLFFNTNFKEFVTFPVLLEKVPTLTKHWQGRHKSRFRPCVTNPISRKMQKKLPLETHTCKIC